MNNYFYFKTLINTLDATYFHKIKAYSFEEHLKLFQPFLLKFLNTDEVSFKIIFGYLLSSEKEISSYNQYKLFLKEQLDLFNNAGIQNLNDEQIKKINNFFIFIDENFSNFFQKAKLISLLKNDLLNKNLHNDFYLDNFLLKIKDDFIQSLTISPEANKLDLFKLLYEQSKEHFLFFNNNLSSFAEKELLHKEITKTVSKNVNNGKNHKI